MASSSLAQEACQPLMWYMKRKTHRTPKRGAYQMWHRVATRKTVLVQMFKIIGYTLEVLDQQMRQQGQKHRTQSHSETITPSQMKKFSVSVVK